MSEHLEKPPAGLHTALPPSPTFPPPCHPPCHPLLTPPTPEGTAGDPRAACIKDTGRERGVACSVILVCSRNVVSFTVKQQKKYTKNLRILTIV